MQRIMVIAVFAAALLAQAFGAAYAHGVQAHPGRQASHAELHQSHVPHSHQHDGTIKLDKSLESALHVLQDTCLGATMLTEVIQLCAPSHHALRLAMAPGRGERLLDPAGLIRPPRFNA